MSFSVAVASPDPGQSARGTDCSMCRRLTQELDAGWGRDLEYVEGGRDERVVADKPRKIDHPLVAPACAHPLVDVVAYPVVAVIAMGKLVDEPVVGVVKIGGSAIGDRRY